MSLWRFNLLHFCLSTAALQKEVTALLVESGTLILFREGPPHLPAPGPVPGPVPPVPVLSTCTYIELAERPSVRNDFDSEVHGVAARAALRGKSGAAPSPFPW